MEIKLEKLAKKNISYNKVEAIRLMYESFSPVDRYAHKDDVRSNKYVRLAKDRDYSNYKIGTVQDLMRLGVMDLFSVFVRQFFLREGIFLAVFNTYADKPVAVVFRSLVNKEFIDYSIFTNIYGLDRVREDFSYGDCMIVTEGVYDADVFRFLHQDTVAVYTSSAGVMQAQILSTMTDNFVLAFDNDTAGVGGFSSAKRNLLRVNNGVRVERLIIYNNDKDLGNIDDTFDGERESRVDYYRSSLRLLT